MQDEAAYAGQLGRRKQLRQAGRREAVQAQFLDRGGGEDVCRSTSEAGPVRDRAAADKTAGELEFPGDPGQLGELSTPVFPVSLENRLLAVAKVVALWGEQFPRAGQGDLCANEFGTGR